MTKKKINFGWLVVKKIGDKLSDNMHKTGWITFSLNIFLKK
jgi:hypothetical protein